MHVHSKKFFNSFCQLLVTKHYFVRKFIVFHVLYLLVYFIQHFFVSLINFSFLINLIQYFFHFLILFHSMLKPKMNHFYFHEIKLRDGPVLFRKLQFLLKFFIRANRSLISDINSHSRWQVGGINLFPELLWVGKVQKGLTKLV